MRTTEQQLPAESLTLDSPIHTLVSSDTVETRGKQALSRLAGYPCFPSDRALAGALHSATDKVNARALWDRQIEVLTLGESIALYVEVFERAAHNDLMADRITHRQYSTRLTRLRNKVIG